MSLKDRSHSSYIIAWITGILILGCCLTAGADDLDLLCTQRCEVPEGERIVRIDANTFKLNPADRIFFDRGTPIELVVHNKNPFINEYELEIEAVELELETIRSFLGQVGLLPGSLDDEEAGDDGEDAGDAALADGGCQLEGFKATVRQIVDLRRQAITKYNETMQGLRLANAKIQAHAKFVGNAKKPITGERQCRAICKEAGTVAAGLEEAMKLNALRKSLSELQSLLTQMTGLREVLRFRAEAMPTGSQEEKDRKKDCTDEVAFLGDHVDKTKEQATKADEDVGELVKNVPALASQRKGVLDVLQNPEAFVDRIPLSARPKATRYDLKLTCKPLGDGKERTENLGTIQVGRNRFSITAGLGISFIEEEAFGRQSAPGDDGSTVSRFAVTETSSEHLAGVFQLNARLGSLSKSKRVGIAWSLGAGIAGDDGTTEVSLYTGPSLSFLDDKLFFTLAFHQRDVEELAGFALGDLVPDDLEGELPTVKKKDDGVLLTITYRFN